MLDVVDAVDGGFVTRYRRGAWVEDPEQQTYVPSRPSGVDPKLLETVGPSDPWAKVPVVCDDDATIYLPGWRFWKRVGDELVLASSSERSALVAEVIAQRREELDAATLRDKEANIRRRYIRDASLEVLRGNTDPVVEELIRIVAGDDFRSRSGYGGV